MSNKPKGKSYGDQSGPSAGVNSGLGEVSRFNTSECDPPEDTKTGRAKEVSTPPRRVVK